MDLRHVLAHTKQYFSQEVTKGSGKVCSLAVRRVGVVRVGFDWVGVYWGWCNSYTLL